MIKAKKRKRGKETRAAYIWTSVCRPLLLLLCAVLAQLVWKSMSSEEGDWSTWASNNRMTAFCIILTLLQFSLHPIFFIPCTPSVLLSQTSGAQFSSANIPSRHCLLCVLFSVPLLGLFQWYSARMHQLVLRFSSVEFECRQTSLFRTVSNLSNSTVFSRFIPLL